MSYTYSWRPRTILHFLVPTPSPHPGAGSLPLWHSWLSLPYVRPPASAPFNLLFLLPGCSDCFFLLTPSAYCVVLSVFSGTSSITPRCRLSFLHPLLHTSTYLSRLLCGWDRVTCRFVFLSIILLDFTCRRFSKPLWTLLYFPLCCLYFLHFWAGLFTNTHTLLSTSNLWAPHELLPRFISHSSITRRVSCTIPWQFHSGFWTKHCNTTGMIIWSNCIMLY